MTPNFASGTVWTGDNLPVMRGMNDACVDLIYLDPPFNKERDFEAPIGSQAAGAAFKDAWTLDDVDVCEHGELADRNPAAYAVIEAARLTRGKSLQSYLIFMAVRLIEMRRLLKPDGSIYLHCDDTAGHYLKVLMDAIFGGGHFRNAITWRRATAHNDPGRYGRISDYLLFYTAGEKWTWNDVREEPDESKIEKAYPRVDEDGRRYRSADLTGAAHGTSGGESSREWKGYDVASRGRVWSPPKTGTYADYIEEHLIPAYKAIAGVHDRLAALDEAGLIVHPQRGFWPGLKRYADADMGKPLQDIIWKPTGLTNYNRKERTGYPTQKPVALLDRIVKASSNPGDMILDPFCGCATALVVADRLSRRWAGIDLSPLAVKLVDERIAEDRGLWGGATVPDGPPARTDLGDLPNYRTHRHRLYGEQEGVCAGCETHFPFRVMDVDHMLPRVRGGTDHPDNLQLLCSGCNRSKGGKTMAEWRAAQ
ncbi:MAG: DNA methyltransferase [Rhodospirillaceae bacterium]|nr:DNA methyltransferase [Rhodospirillaceae bacterium]MDE0360236.1 DNA methyltransferase [Rhodospirillaceae bacterium]